MTLIASSVVRKSHDLRMTFIFKAPIFFFIFSLGPEHRWCDSLLKLLSLFIYFGYYVLDDVVLDYRRQKLSSVIIGPQILRATQVLEIIE